MNGLEVLDFVEFILPLKKQGAIKDLAVRESGRVYLHIFDWTYGVFRAYDSDHLVYEVEDDEEYEVFLR